MFRGKVVAHPCLDTNKRFHILTKNPALDDYFGTAQDKLFREGYYRRHQNPARSAKPLLDMSIRCTVMNEN